MAGGPLQTGAARLAARAGQRIGAGWVTLVATRAACDIIAQHETSILIYERDLNTTLANQIVDFRAVVIGPALGLEPQSAADTLGLIGDFIGGLILDADSLTHIAQNRENAFQRLRERSEPAILTPHEGEFANLFGAFNPSDKAEVTILAARRSGSLIVHKGATTFLASPDGLLFASTSHAPFLATAGTGDVLAGMIGGLIAQGLDGMAACKAALWIHGETGRQIGAGLIAEDIIKTLPVVLRDVFETAVTA